MYYQNQNEYQIYELNNRKDLLNESRRIREELLAKVDTLKDIKYDGYVDLIYYFMIVGILMFFIYIILSDIYRTLKFHQRQNEDSQRKSYGKNSNSEKLMDDNEYPDEQEMINNNENIRVKLEEKQASLDNEMNSLQKFKRENNINSTLHTSINTKVINRENDNYNYPKRKEKLNFWEMLFTKPQYHSVTNNATDGYFEFI